MSSRERFQRSGCEVDLYLAEEVAERNAERARQDFDIDQADVSDPTFDPGNVRPVEDAFQREGLLREPPCLAELPNPPAEPKTDVLDRVHEGIILTFGQ